MQNSLHSFHSRLETEDQKTWKYGKKQWSKIKEKREKMNGTSTTATQYQGVQHIKN